MELTCSGVALDTSPDRFGELRDANEILGDYDALRARMDEDGYLLFRELIDPDRVLAARREIMLKFAVIGEVDGIDHDPIEGIHRTPSFTDQVNLVAFTESVRTGLAYQNVVNDGRILAFYEGFLGGQVRGFDFKWPRFVRPGEGCGIHADVVYVGRATKNVWSTWIPLGDVPREDGSLVILEGSHRRADRLGNYWSKDADRDNVGWLGTNPIKLQKAVGGRWLTTDFRAGDVICFSIYLVHAALDNRSPLGRCRLTSDTRYQLTSDPLDDRWNGDISNPHGGPPKVFMPGLVKADNNRRFEEEWKPVDADGRLTSQGAVHA
jgi:ectoine hydroxylase-related dioxygenase (phytanoyl-CoA dioxygenase family)